MEIFGFKIPGLLIGCSLLFVSVLLSERAERDAESKNENAPTPPWHQVAWGVRHSRQDLRLIALLLAAILLTLWIKF